ncbi:TPA: hypothetical protein DCX15_01340 [bacterium]|nr:hypothetical protein [bacterium]
MDIKIPEQAVNYLINILKAERYLEIGVASGGTYLAVNCKEKVGVDPHPQFEGILKMTSQEFWKTSSEPFDVIFIDGDHSFGVSQGDLLNALNFIHAKSYILLHDTNPEDVTYTISGGRADGLYTGEVYKTVMWAKQNPALDYITLDMPFGMTVVKLAKNPNLLKEEPDYSFDNFAKERDFWLNLKSSTSETLDKFVKDQKEEKCKKISKR